MCLCPFDKKKAEDFFCQKGQTPMCFSPFAKKKAEDFFCQEAFQKQLQS